MSKGMIEGFAAATGAIAAALVTHPISTVLPAAPFRPLLHFRLQLSTDEAARPRGPEENPELNERQSPSLFSLHTVMEALYDVSHPT